MPTEAQQRAALDTHQFVDDDSDGPQQAYCRRCLGNRDLIAENATRCPTPAED